MHELKRIPLRAVAALLLLAAPLATALGCERLWVADGDLYAADGQSARLIVSDARGIEAAAWSPRGDRVAYARAASDDTALDLVIVDRNGQKLRTLAIPSDVFTNAILSIGWRSEQRVYAIGHVNPSTSMYLEWDAGNGRLTSSIPGSHFAVSPDGRSVAYRANVPHGAPKPFDSARIMIDERVVWPSPGDDSHHEVRGGPAWSRDGRIAILDLTGEVASLVIIDARRKAATRTPLPAAMEGELSWTESGAVSLRSGDELWLIEPGSGRTEKSLRPSAADEPPPVLRERHPHALLRAGGSRCGG